MHPFFPNMKRTRPSRSVLLPLLALLCSAAAGQEISRKLVWNQPVEASLPGIRSIQVMHFDGAGYDTDNNPVFEERIPLSGRPLGVTAQLLQPVFEELTNPELLRTKGTVSTSPEVTASVAFRKKQAFAAVRIFPFRRNPATGRLERLISFRLLLVPSAAQARLSARTYAASSVLASGRWYKMAVAANGVYRLDYAYLQSMGIDPGSIDPRHIRIYGNGGRQLPYANADFRYDDLQERAIFVSGENDGAFNSGDYVLFYATGPTAWSYSSTDRRYHHAVHAYSDTAYYFLTTDLGAGKRITPVGSSPLPPTDAVAAFDDYAYHETDKTNLLKSGREWYGENFDLISSSFSFSFSFPNRVTTDSAYILVRAAGRSQSDSNYFYVNANGSLRCKVANAKASPQYYLEYARENSASSTYISPEAAISGSLVFNSSDNTAIGWLNYIEVNVRRLLTFSGAGNSLEFRDARVTGPGRVAAYSLSGASSAAQVWDVTDPLEVYTQQFTLAGNTLSFSRASDSLRTFVAFNGPSLPSPAYSGRVDNQDLHAMGFSDMLIISNPSFLSSANRLAQFHRDHDQLTVSVVPTNQIFNEFSSGAQDASAIRDFLKMFYDRASGPSELTRYVLIFGDASYDNKNRIQNNTNFVTSYESAESLNLSKSYASDDFYGFLDDNEGLWRENDNDLLDVAIGRLPVKSLTECDAVVNKIITYASPDPPGTPADTAHCAVQSASAFGDWRNLMLFVADDEDGNTHMQQAQYLADSLTWGRHPVFTVDKIYLDAYKQQSTPGGERYPEVQSAIVSRVERGALLVTYVGHGGELGWAQERVLEVNDINGWTNFKALPAFLTATCEFSRVDDPARTSAGEYVLLNPNGGGIGLFTTTRLAFSNTNNDLAIRFFNNFFPANGSIPAMGDIFEKTKIESSNLYLRNFFLLGDPALRLNYPRNKVITSSINSVPVSTAPDTLSALSKVTVTGYIADTSGNKMTGFNGVIYPTVFDKVAYYNTLANDPGNSLPASFKLQKNILFKGKATVTNGDFSFTFVLPKDISFQYGKGKLSYYADNGTTDAAGYYDNIIIGGVNTSAGTDAKGPEVRLYMNDENFVFGGTTDDSPVLLAVVSDTSGVNTVGNGIGHDITARLDDDNEKQYVLNDYFEYDQNSYQDGRVQYPLSKLSEGRHSVRLKVWDVYNNSSEATLEFVVASSASLALKHVFNYPNPFTTHTTFFFEHNRPCSEMDVRIQVFTVSGKLVKTLQQKIITEGFRSEDVSWDGLDDFGDKIGKGAYIYKLQIRTPDGLRAEQFEKLVILR
jgi:hypothetical protein